LVEGTRLKNNESIITEKRGNPDPRLFRFEGPDRHEQQLEILKSVLEETRKQN
jgi:hypothetical protein